ncbi:hypothetical protein MSG28_001707 [Choristoneura fumiferana]|uniref:Uncharacterized protein n=1 Tax=Choristoneura fumiferana TaxID=7141 RepID=A0ACC0KV79_CHOFU|nr:hypothetical protein MSG28_001707 [Choristoneura fumiferana]
MNKMTLKQKFGLRIKQEKKMNDFKYNVTKHVTENGLNKRCIRCRSRGELGSCGDPLPFNVTDPDAEPGIHAVACPSGWCGKMIQGTTGAFRTDDYGSATERMCLQRPPSDYEERCAYTMWNYKKVYMCFCTGDLCNSGFRMSISYYSILAAVLVGLQIRELVFSVPAYLLGCRKHMRRPKLLKRAGLTGGRNRPSGQRDSGSGESTLYGDSGSTEFIDEGVARILLKGEQLINTKNRFVSRALISPPGRQRVPDAVGETPCWRVHADMRRELRAAYVCELYGENKQAGHKSIEQ